MTNSKSFFLPALLAAGTGLVAAPASALELGDLQVDSALGHPLRASIAVALAPNEELAGYCISATPGDGFGNVAALNMARVTIANGRILVAGEAAVMDPILAVRVSINCPYAPRLSREYTAFVDPAVTRPVPTQVPTQVPAPVAARRSDPRPAAAPAPAPATPARAASAAAANLPLTQRYQVRRGDSLSAIAQRVDHTGMALWDVVDILFAANPDAFIDNDPNRLKAGSWLDIPDLAAESAPAPALAAPERPAESLVPDAVPTNEAATAAVDRSPPLVAATPHSDAASEELATARPGDVIVDGHAVVAPQASPVAAPESPIVATAPSADVPSGEETPAATPAAQSPAAPPARIVTVDRKAAEPPDTSLWWLVGGGFLLLGGLLLAALRSRFGSSPAPVDDEPAHPLRRASDTTVGELPTLAPFVADDYELEDDAPTAENLVLDANLDIGSGFAGDGDGEILVAEDFGFSDGPAALDLEFPDEAPVEDERPETDILPPLRAGEGSILESEVLPDDDDYDMSVIMDATKVPDPVDVTERDLKAVVIDSGEDTQVTDAYTVSKEVDYQVLEQDYEEELSATQALNLEIERAAAALAESLDAEIRADEAADTDDDQAASSPPAASVTAINAMVVADDGEAVDELDITSAMEAAERAGETVNTARLPSVDEDTAEMTIESGRLDTKKKTG